MRYGILGTTTAHHDDGTPVPLGGARLRALLAALVLREGRPVPAEVLIDEVWDTEPPQDAAAALQTLVGRLRRTIGRDEVGSGPGGYWLTGPRTDLGRFQELAARGGRALDAGEAEPAARDLRAALALWRGPALADLPDRAGSAVRLEAQRAEAQRRRIAADLVLGRATEVAAELAGLCADRPLDEPLHVLWIRALRQTGRTAEALSRYETVRRALAERLGADPGTELRQLHRELLEPSVKSAKREVTSVASARGPVGNLRPLLTSFVGRSQDLRTLSQLLGGGRLVTLTGPGGSGKTRLSVEAGRALQQAGEDFPDGVWQAELAPLESPSAVPGAVLSALGLRGTVLHHSTVAEVVEGRSEDPVRQIVERCGRGRMLLILDNCEHLVDAAATLADRLLGECPGLTVLATSREPLGVPGEAVLPVEPLPDPTALRLLAERGAAARPGFDPADDPAACAEICRRLDGLPLAIELAAARLRSMTPRQLADRLDGRFALLTGGSRILLPRQQTLRAVVDWSWELLDERERAVLRRLSVFAGGCTLEDAVQVCADPAGPAAAEVAEPLFSLVDKSLLVAVLNPEGPPRYRMLETIHEYAAERLAEAGETEPVRRHLHHFRELARTASRELHGPRQLELIALLEREQDNIRAALRRAVDAGDEQEALVLVLGMSWFWSLRDYHTESRQWYEEVAALGPNAFDEHAPRPVPLLVDPLDAPPPMARELLEEARRQLQLQVLISLFTGNMAMLGDPEVGRVAHRVLAMYTPDLPQSYRFPMVQRVFAAFLAGEMDRMRPLLDETVEGCRRHGRPHDLAFVLQIRARLMNDWAGGLEQAIRDTEEALELFTRAGDRWGMSESLSARGENAARSGDSARAVEYYGLAIELAREIGARQEASMLQVRLGEAMFDSDREAGERLIREAMEAVSAGSQVGDGALLYGRMVLCSLHARRGEYAEALGELDRLELDHGAFGPVMPQIFQGIVGCCRAWVVARAGEPGRGLELLREGRRLVRSVESGANVFAEHMTMMLMLPAVGVLVERAVRDGSRPAAVRGAELLGAHLGLHGIQGSVVEREEREHCERGLVGLLGEEAYRTALAAGGALTLSEACVLLDDLDGL
ncbi:BTAD domain-containing putative transcriptional regulator [Kitasatospora sp. NPDC052896]|uniref:BTAD domain-containing putative transcriptional regulator n=1 Tax=Kitasatospora sp. NPDC052896 TaxID=3364061 RepID=UPI0037C8937A